jgi:DNA-binding transcriptional LysR family regulator
MNIGMFATLVAIVERGTLAAAAKQVGCTPSAVSLQVKQLEAYFRQPLFDRSTRAVKPTPFG